MPSKKGQNKIESTKVGEISESRLVKMIYKAILIDLLIISSASYKRNHRKNLKVNPLRLTVNLPVFIF
jgi:hypothetical protein